MREEKIVDDSGTPYDTPELRCQKDPKTGKLRMSHSHYSENGHLVIGVLHDANYAVGGEPQPAPVAQCKDRAKGGDEPDSGMFGTFIKLANTGWGRQIKNADVFGGEQSGKSEDRGSGLAAAVASSSSFEEGLGQRQTDLLEEDHDHAEEHFEPAATVSVFRVSVFGAAEPGPFAKIVEQAAHEVFNGVKKPRGSSYRWAVCVVKIFVFVVWIRFLLCIVRPVRTSVCFGRGGIPIIRSRDLAE